MHSNKHFGDASKAGHGSTIYKVVIINKGGLLLPLTSYVDRFSEFGILRYSSDNLHSHLDALERGLYHTLGFLDMIYYIKCNE